MGHDLIPRRILVTQTAFLGDVVLTTALTRLLQEEFPTAEVFWLVRPDAVSIVRPLVPAGHVLSYAKRDGDRGWDGFRRMAKAIAALEVDVALAVQRSMRTAALLKWAGIPRRIGFSGAMASALYTDRVAYRGKHVRDRIVRLAQGLGVSVKDPPLPRLQIDPEASATTEERLGLSGMAEGERLLVVAPGSAWPTKQWPAVKFGKVAGELLRRDFDRCLVVGGKKDQALAAEVLSASGYGADRVFDWTGRTTVAELVALIGRASLVIANDSGPGHIAAAVGTPLVAIFGPTTPAMGFVPLGPSVLSVGQDDLACRPCSRHGAAVCPIGTHACMEELPPGAILAAVRRLPGNSGD